MNKSISLSRSRPYAKAIFAIAEKNNAFDAWADALSFLANIISVRETIQLIMHPHLAKDKFIAILQNEFTTAPDDFWSFLHLLFKKQAVGLLPYIYELFEELRLKRDNKIVVDVTTARKLESDETERLACALKKRLQRDVVLNLKNDAGLIGGIIVNVDNRIIDASIRSKLRSFICQLTH